MRQITLAQFIAMYERNEVNDIAVVKDKVYGKSTLGMVNTNPGYEIVWAPIPP